jgi:hypothetical protein
MRVCLLLVLFACSSSEVQPSLSPVSPPTTALTGAALSVPSTIAASAPASLPASAATKGTTIVARLVDGERPIIACGIIAYIGVYVYEIESVETGEALSGRLVVDVLCPDFLLGKVKFKVGERHRIVLDKAKKTYAGATPMAPPQSGLPRFTFLSITNAAP